MQSDTTTITIDGQPPEFIEVSEIARDLHGELKGRYESIDDASTDSEAARLLGRQGKWAGTGWGEPVGDLIGFARLYLFSALDQLAHAGFAVLSPSTFGVEVAARVCIETNAMAYDLCEAGVPEATRMSRAFRHRVWARRELVNLATDSDSAEGKKQRRELKELAKHGAHLRLSDTDHPKKISQTRTGGSDACRALFDAGFAEQTDVGTLLYRRFSATAHANPAVLAALGDKEFDPTRALLRFAPSIPSAAFAILVSAMSTSIATSKFAEFMGHPTQPFPLGQHVQRLNELARVDRGPASTP